MNRAKQLKNQLTEIEKELAAIAAFRPTQQLERFKRHLAGEASFIKRQIVKLQTPEKELERERQSGLVEANKNRKEKMKRTWRYVKSVQQNYAPEKSAKEIRTLLRKHRKGLETEIPDVAWRNPSP
jgi:predicted phage-related endonuclease